MCVTVVSVLSPSLLLKCYIIGDQLGDMSLPADASQPLMCCRIFLLLFDTKNWKKLFAKLRGWY